MGTPTGSVIGECKQPNPILALLRVLLWVALVAGSLVYFVLTTSLYEAPHPPPIWWRILPAVAFAGGLIAFIIDFSKIFGGKAIEVRSDGLIFKKRNGGVASSVLYTEIESSLLVPQKSATCGGGAYTGTGSALRLNQWANQWVTEMAREQTMTGVSTDRDSNLRLPIEVSICAYRREVFRLDNSYRDKAGCCKATAHAMSDALLQGVLQTIESGKPVPLANEYGSTDKLTVSRDGVQGPSEPLMPWASGSCGT